jgi:hypothetical protein
MNNTNTTPEPTEADILKAVAEAREAHRRYIAAVDTHDEAQSAYMSAQARVIEMMRVAEPKSHLMQGAMIGQVGQARVGKAQNW